MSPPHGGPPPMPVERTVSQLVAPVFVGPEPLKAICPHCHANIVSTVETRANTKTHLLALLLCASGCWLCCCIPYYMDSCQGRKHFCPNCNAYLGTYSE